MNQIQTHRYDNGLVLVAEKIESAQSLAMAMLLPAGTAQEPDDQIGVATLLSDMMFRGSETMSSREHSDAMDDLGLDRSTSVDSLFLRLNATMIHNKLDDALPLLFDMVLKPALTEENLEPARDLAIQGLEALEDEPQQKTFIALRQRHYRYPMNRCTFGEIEAIENMTVEQVQTFKDKTFVPGGTILSFAGQFDFEHLKAKVGELLGDWQGSCEEVSLSGEPKRGYEHLKAESQQVHIGMAYDAVDETDEEAAMLQRAAIAVLSGGMSGRLFTEVREKRGLCYAVYGTYASNKLMGVVLGYAGTTPQRAQETLDVMRGEFVRLSEGIEQSEFDRAMVGMKTRLVMQGESTRARASAIAMDQHTFGSPRTLDQLIAQVDAVTLDQLNEYVKANVPGAMTIITIGPDALTA
jgi:predicted Zn-dependent peptidase